MSGQLVRYDEARRALAECVRVDEAKDIRDKAEALAAYARQRDDHDLACWISEIKLRACTRIGEISRELETSRGGANPQATLPSGGKSKVEVLAEAGISTSAANRYEELAGGRTERGQAAAAAAAEAYFARSQQEDEVPTMDGLRGAIRSALVETLGPPPDRTNVASFRNKPDPLADALGDFGVATSMLAGLSTDPATLAAMVQPELVDWHLRHARQAETRIHSFIATLERREQRAS